LEPAFEKWWPELEIKVNDIFAKLGQADEEPIREDRDLLEEILELSRVTSRNLRKYPMLISPGAIYDLLKKYIALHNSQVIGEGGYQETLDHLQSMEKSIKYIANLFKRAKMKNWMS